MPAYIFAVGADAEQGTKPSQVSAKLSLGLHIPGAGRRFGKHLCLCCAVYSRELCHWAHGGVSRAEAFAEQSP